MADEEEEEIIEVEMEDPAAAEAYRVEIKNAPKIQVEASREGGVEQVTQTDSAEDRSRRAQEYAQRDIDNIDSAAAAKETSDYARKLKNSERAQEYAQRDVDNMDGEAAAKEIKDGADKLRGENGEQQPEGEGGQGEEGQDGEEGGEGEGDEGGGEDGEGGEGGGEDAGGEDGEGEDGGGEDDEEKDDEDKDGDEEDKEGDESGEGEPHPDAQQVTPDEEHAGSVTAVDSPTDNADSEFIHAADDYEHGTGVDPDADQSWDPDVDTSGDAIDGSSDYTDDGSTDDYTDPTGRGEEEDPNDERSEEEKADEEGSQERNEREDSGGGDDQGGGQDGKDKKDDKKDDKAEAAGGEEGGKGGGGAGKKKNKIEWKEGDPFTIKLMTKVWNGLFDNKATQPMCMSINESLDAAIVGATMGTGIVAKIAKKLAFMLGGKDDTLGMCLKLASSDILQALPTVATLVKLIEGIFNTILKMPLTNLFKIGVPILNGANAAQGAGGGGK